MAPRSVCLKYLLFSPNSLKNTKGQQPRKPEESPSGSKAKDLKAGAVIIKAPYKKGAMAMGGY